MGISKRKSAGKRQKATIKKQTARSARANVKFPRMLRGFILPGFLSLSIIGCLGVLAFFGYRSVTASDFFVVEHISVYGTDRSSKEEIERMIAMQTERSGAWNADLEAIRTGIEHMTFVKSAAVSRALPDGIRVNVKEHIPVAVVRLTGGDFLVDAEGWVIAQAAKPEEKIPVALIGWNEMKSPAAEKENTERIKIYMKFVEAMHAVGLQSRVDALNLTDVREPRAVAEDSGSVVSIAIGRENYGENLKRGIQAILGKGDIFEAVDLVGQNMILAPRKGAALGGTVK